MKKVIWLAVCLAMILSLCTVVSFADNGAATADVWDGSIANGFADESTGAEGDPIIITTGAELAFFADEVNIGENYEGIYFKLGNDIDLAGLPFAPIGGETGAHIFTGNFNGDGHTVKGLNIPDTITKNYDYAGLFGVVHHGGCVRNLNVEGNFTSTAKGHFGVIAGKVQDNGSIVNCSVKGNITINRATTTSTTIYVGGIAGLAQQHSKIEDCVFSGSLTINGLPKSATDESKRCTVVAGGIVGRGSSNGAIDSDLIYVKNCIFDGNITIPTAYNIFVGGLFGVNNDLSVAPASKSVVLIQFENCVAKGNISVGSEYNGSSCDVGGLAGSAMNNLKFVDCNYSGMMTVAGNVSNRIGGTVGTVYAAGEMSEFSKCTTSYNSLKSAYTEETAERSNRGVYSLCSANVFDVDSYIATINGTITQNFEADKSHTASVEASYVPVTSDDETTTAKSPDTSDNDDPSDTTTEAPVVTTPQPVEITTTAPQPSDVSEPEEGCAGCGGFPAAAALAVVAFGGLAVIIRKRH